MSLEPWLQVLLLVCAANGAPILIRWWLGSRLDFPVDLGRCWYDGQRLLGPTKTLRGVAAGIAAAVLGAPLLGLPTVVGWLVGGGAVLGDLLSSFLKRRLRMAPSSRAAGLDQIPESLLPVLAAREAMGLDAWQLVMVVCIFLLLDMILSPLLYWVHIRRRPY